MTHVQHWVSTVPLTEENEIWKVIREEEEKLRYTEGNTEVISRAEERAMMMTIVTALWFTYSLSEALPSGTMHRGVRCRGRY